MRFFRDPKAGSKQVGAVSGPSAERHAWPVGHGGSLPALAGEPFVDVLVNVVGGVADSACDYRVKRLVARRGATGYGA